MTDDKADLILSRLDDTRRHISGRIDELRDRIAVQNGRIGKLESTDAVLIERIDTIQRRGCAVADLVHDGTPLPMNRASWWRPSKPLAQGGVGAGIVIGIIELAKVVVTRVW